MVSHCFKTAQSVSSDVTPGYLEWAVLTGESQAKANQITLYSALEGLQNFHGKMEETISMIITWIINKWAKKGNFPFLFFSPRL